MRIGIFLLLSFILTSPCLADFPAPTNEVIELRAPAHSGDEKSLAGLGDAAEAGSTWAQVWLGDLYSKGEVLPKDDAEAVKWYRQAAEKGNPEGLENLADAYGSGQGVKSDAKEAMRLHIEAAEDSGNPYLQFKLGWRYSMGQDGFVSDKAEAVKWYRKYLSNSFFDVWAVSDLADIYAFGRGNVAQDTVEAYFWASLLTKTYPDFSNPDYQKMVNKILAMPLTDEDKKLVDQRIDAWRDRASSNTETPVHFYEIISDLQTNTETAKKVLQDRKKRLAQGDGVKKVESAIHSMYLSPKDLVEVTQWAEAGDLKAQLALAWLYQYGQGKFKADLSMAQKWWLKAAERGDTKAQYMAANNFMSQENYSDAVLWLRKAADLNHFASAGMLGFLYLKGIGVPQNMAEAARFFKVGAGGKDKSSATWLAAMRGDARAQFSKGLDAKYNKLYLKPDEEAFFWFSLASNSKNDLSFIDGDGNTIFAASERDKAAAILSPEQKLVVEKRVSEWRPIAP